MEQAADLATPFESESKSESGSESESESESESYWKRLAPDDEDELREDLKDLADSPRLAGLVERLELQEEHSPRDKDHVRLSALLARALPHMHRLTWLDMEWNYWYTTPALLAALCAKPGAPLEVLTLNPRVEAHDDLECLRDVSFEGAGHLRRLRLNCEKTHLDLRGERRRYRPYYDAITRLITSSADSLTEFRFHQRECDVSMAWLLGDVAVFPQLRRLSVHQQSMASFPCAAPKLEYLKIHFDTYPDVVPFPCMDEVTAFVLRFPTIKMLNIIYEGEADTATPESLPTLGPSLLAHLPDLREISLQCAYILEGPNCGREWQQAEMQAVLDGWTKHCKSLKHMVFPSRAWTRKDDAWAPVGWPEYEGELATGVIHWFD